MNSTTQRVLELKEAEQDFEWYPTTQEIIETVAEDMRELSGGRYGIDHKLMDVGAGDGRVLIGIEQVISERKGGRLAIGLDLFAIEKAIPHLSNMPKQIVVLGTDFTQQMLVDKKMDFTFCNPPYSEYVEWTVKLIRESTVQYLYLVIPKRWRESEDIADALKATGLGGGSLHRDDIVSLGELDFENADRKARAKVEVVRLWLGSASRSAFNSAIEEMLPELDVFSRTPEDQPRAQGHCELLESGESLIESLVRAYDAELASMVNNYRMVCRLDIDILSELNIDHANVVSGIKEKIIGLKSKYWRVLFDRMKPITKRLASKQRKLFMDSLDGKATIDFTESNIYSILIWVSKWANEYYDEQLIELFRKMSEYCNVVNYKSNANTWEKGNWRYQDQHTHYKLEYRMVIERVGGIYAGQWSFEDRRGLSETAYSFISDMVTVANNLGFDSDASPADYKWVSNKQNTLLLNNGQPLVAVRAFKNGNQHIHWNPKIMLAINVEAGRLLGWIRNPQEAVREMQVSGEDAQFVADAFGSSYRIEPSRLLLN